MAQIPAPVCSILVSSTLWHALCQQWNFWINSSCPKLNPRAAAPALHSIKCVAGEGSGGRRWRGLCVLQGAAARKNNFVSACSKKWSKQIHFSGKLVPTIATAAATSKVATFLALAPSSTPAPLILPSTTTPHRYVSWQSFWTLVAATRFLLLFDFRLIDLHRVDLAQLRLGSLEGCILTGNDDTWHWLRKLIFHVVTRLF